MTARLKALYRYARYVVTSDDPQPLWSAALAFVSVAVGAGVVNLIGLFL